MEKLVVSREARDAVTAASLDAPVARTLATAGLALAGPWRGPIAEALA